MLNHINLADIRSFVLIAQLGNFTKAAEALDVSRSHVSRQISALETQMGVTLLTRTTRTLKLTPAGKRFYQQCEKALHSIDQALMAAVDDTEQVRGLIRINCVGGYIGEAIIARYVSDFMARYPDVQVNLDFSSHRIDLIQDEFDIAFRMGELEDASFVARKLMEIETVTLASPAYIEQYGSPQHPRELTSHRCLTGSVRRWSYQSVTDANEHYDAHVEGRFICKNGSALLTGAMSGNGIIRVPLMYCRDSVERGDLVRILPQWQIPKVLFSAIFHKDKYQPKRLRTFIDYINQRFQQDSH
ncbi:LysR family transcriptional regulator [Vibrio sp. SCSIO 43137]|uniref:LysR family transcriptional regulator n=1 Tax=Vibrio sp. SCSIO 43137 TaxID=3021011 RepID=UPI0023072DD6|nr:LysR family transcriptional regulator [Vibrio sp. SCSIO 43137]WCE31656.1 LysR family transcriptional regulator [Vibrio sp. SCSIO 43137]